MLYCGVLCVNSADIMIAHITCMRHHIAPLDAWVRTYTQHVRADGPRPSKAYSPMKVWLPSTQTRCDHHTQPPKACLQPLTLSPLFIDSETWRHHPRVGRGHLPRWDRHLYEGVLTKGYSTDAADDAVQANIVAAGFGKQY